MKIYVTQGHEKGIGLEVFFKSCLLLPPSELSNISLIAYAETVEKTLLTLKLPFEIFDDCLFIADIKIGVAWLDKVDHSQSFTALSLGMKLSELGGILYTLPTSKDQFPLGAGHTEYFRHFYRRNELGMFFSSPQLQVLLLTDHLPLKKLSHYLTEKLIYERLKASLATLSSWDWPVAQILISGINPHAGEGGLIGDEDQRIVKAMKRLSSSTTLPMSGPLPGDTMLLEKSSAHDLLVYMFHDQGLGVFKSTQGFIGSNITLGLPYPRFSPDHGTSFGLFGKNQADYRGCKFSLKEALSLSKRLWRGKNSSNQS
jgi:hypothetical protein